MDTKSSRESLVAGECNSPRHRLTHCSEKTSEKFSSLYSQYGKDSILLDCLAYNCGPGVVNKSSFLKKLKAGDRNIFKVYTFHCRYKGKWHKGIHNRRLVELTALFVP